MSHGLRGKFWGFKVEEEEIVTPTRIQHQMGSGVGDQHGTGQRALMKGCGGYQ